jgi:ABC-type Zn2+ transport system substrate-binding protein/surface adhesin
VGWGGHEDDEEDKDEDEDDDDDDDGGGGGDDHDDDDDDRQHGGGALVLFMEIMCSKIFWQWGGVDTWYSKVVVKQSGYLLVYVSQDDDKKLD